MNSSVAVIVAGGTGSRMAGGIPKTYRLLNGKPVIAHSLQAFSEHRQIERIIVVHHADHQALLAPILADYPKVEAVLGGQTRQESVRNGLEYLSNVSLGGQQADSAMSPRSGVPSEQQNVAHGAQINKVLIHDAARPNISQTLITRMLETAAKAALPVIPVTDTIKHKAGHTLDRSELVAAQTPQAFDYATILKLHRENTDAVTDDAMLAELASIEVAFVQGDAANRKITTEEDLKMMQSAPRIAVGNGYDVHGFIAHEGDDKTIMICGVPVECDMAIEGHSDGDVGLHALTDAILGCIGNGDIGHHFSSDNPQWKGAASELFLKEAIRLMQQAGGSLSHCDITLIAQMPKLSPHRETMRASVAEICDIDVSQVSIKATTTDHLGFIGRKEGLAAQATATVLL